MLREVGDGHHVACHFPVPLEESAVVAPTRRRRRANA
jgi:hypothetical protein